MSPWRWFFLRRYCSHLKPNTLSDDDCDSALQDFQAEAIRPNESSGQIPFSEAKSVAVIQRAADEQTDGLVLQY